MFVKHGDASPIVHIVESKDLKENDKKNLDDKTKKAKKKLDTSKIIPDEKK